MSAKSLIGVVQTPFLPFGTFCFSFPLFFLFVFVFVFAFVFLWCFHLIALCISCLCLVSLGRGFFGIDGVEIRPGLEVLGGSGQARA